MNKSEVQNVLHRHSLPIIDKNTHLLYEFCDCYISVIEYDGCTDVEIYSAAV